MEQMNILCRAVERNDSHEIRRILAALGPAPAGCLLRRYQSDTRESLLHWACRKGCDVLVAQALIQWGEDANGKSGHGARPTPLIQACRHGDAHLCDGLIELGADLDVTDDMGQTVLHAASSNEANHDADILRLLLEKHGARHLINLIDKSGCFPLLIVCDKGSRSVEAAALLIRHGANVNLAGAREGWTALHCACRFNKPDLVRYLLQHGANPMLIDTSHGEYALTKAAENGLVDVVTELLECSVGHTMEALWNGVLMAATQGHSQVVDMIMDRMNERTVNVHLVPCLAAIYHGNLILLKDKWRTYTKLVDNNITLFRFLLMAAASGRSEIIKYILGRVHVTIDTQDESGLCALHLASYAGHAECVRELVGAGADVNALDKCKKSALLHASFGSSFADVNKCQAVLLTLLQNGAEPNARSVTTTPLHRIAMTGSPEHVRLLFRFGAELVATNIYNKCPVAVAWRQDLRSTLEELYDERLRGDFDTFMISNTGIHASLKHKTRRQWYLHGKQSDTMHQNPGSAHLALTETTQTYQLPSETTPSRSHLPCYPMSQEPRGFAVVINNWKMDGRGRDVHDKDVAGITKLVHYLKFQTIIYENQTSEAMLLLLTTIAQNRQLYHHDAIIIAFLSGGDGEVVQGSDGSLLLLSDIMSVFSEKECSALAGKPKVIFVHSCPGVDSELQRGMAENHHAAQHGQTKEGSMSPQLCPREDDVVCCQTTESLPSPSASPTPQPIPPDLFVVILRTDSDHCDTGSYIVDSLLCVICRMATTTHLADMISEVNRVLSQQTVTLCGKNIAMNADAISTLTKLLYFLPE